MQYYGVLYGNSTLGVPQSLLSNPTRDALLFKPSCLAPAGCVPPGHPWRAMTTSGLDALVMFYIQEATLLLGDPPAALGPNNTHFSFLWDVGAADLSEGLRQFTASYNVDSHTAPLTAQDILIVTFCIMVVANGLFFVRFFLPWLNRMLIESRRVARLLSELPAELSIEELVLKASDAQAAAAAEAAAEAQTPRPDRTGIGKNNNADLYN